MLVNNMKHATLLFLILGAFALRVPAEDISGAISSTLVLSESSRLVGDVTCTVNGMPCIRIAAPNVTLDLNGYTMTGQADAKTACDGGPNTFVPTALEGGVDVQSQAGVTIRGPGLIERFRGPGVFVNQGTGVMVTRVTVSTNCLSGILFGGGSENTVSENISIRNGSGAFACGGI